MNRIRRRFHGVFDEPAGPSVRLATLYKQFRER
jgi:hypothetical protein